MPANANIWALGPETGSYSANLYLSNEKDLIESPRGSGFVIGFVFKLRLPSFCKALCNQYEVKILTDDWVGSRLSSL